MEVLKVKISEIKPNPKNPRLIKDEKFKKLVKSIKDFPQMLELRPIVVDENNIILGGNMRFKALKEAGYTEVSIVRVNDLTAEQKDEFIVKDNVGFGEWDWDSLANEWNDSELIDWGLDLPIIMDEPSYEDLIGEEKNKPATMKITFTSPEQLQKAEIEIQELLDRNYLGAYFSVSAGEI
jgi:ParB-like chromosome segregation protein Spo0J